MANKSKKQGESQTASELPPQSQPRQPGRQHKMQPEPRTIRDDYRGSGKLDGKVALITGGGGEIING